MFSEKNIIKNKKGVTLLELMISISIIIILIMGIYNLILFSLKITADNKAYVEATEIVNQKMEEIRNMPYTDVGTLTGSPVGTIAEHATVSRDNEYNLHTMIMFFDDPYDGTIATTDTIITDYKIVTIDISWQGRFGTKNITVFSKIIPNTEETLAGYGLLKLLIVDANGGPVPNANVHIENALNGLLVDLITDTQGVLAYPVLPSIESYEITATKAGYGTDQTHDRDAVNLNPSKPHLTVFDSVKTEESFTIDKLATLNIQVLSNTQPTNWLVHSLSSFNDNKNVSISIDGSDSLYFAWQSINATSSKIFLQKYSNLEVKQWSSPIEVEITNYQENPDSITDSAGNTYIVWQDNSVTLKATTLSPTKHFAHNNIDNISIVSDMNHHAYDKKLFYRDLIKNDAISAPLNSKILKFLENKFKTPNASAATVDVVFIAAEGETTDNNGLITIDLPAGVVEDDFLLAYIHHDDASDGPIEAPAGWSILHDDLNPGGSSSDSRGNIFWKFAGNSEPASYTFYTRETCSTSWSWGCWCWETTCSRINTRKAGHIRAYRNVDTDNPFDTGINFSTTARNNDEHNTPSQTVSNDGSMLICGWGTDTENLGDNSPTFPATLEHPMNNYANRASAVSADKQVGTANSLEAIDNYDANTNVENASINWSIVLKPVITPDELAISSIGSQNVSTTSPKSNYYVGGSIVATKSTVGSVDITKINLSETGTIDEENSLSNIDLFYDIDTSAPFDCAGEIYNGTEAQFGATQNFDTFTGTSTFTDIGVSVNPNNTICFYVVLDILDTAIKDTTIDIGINDPSNDIQLSSAGSVTPNTSINITGQTTVLKDTELDQVHYRWQEDDGPGEYGTWIATQNLPIQSEKSIPLRIRFEIANNGNITSEAVNYRIEYGKNISTCDAIATWTTLPTTPTADWKMADSVHFVNASSTENVANALTDEKILFTQGEMLDTSNTSSGIALANDEFTEMLYSIEATNSVSDSVYCFRLTNNGSVDKFKYTSYPQVNIIGDKNIYIKKINNSGNTVWSTKKINSDMSTADQINPRIAYTNNTGISATTTIVWVDDRNSSLDVYLQNFEDDGTKQFTLDVQVTSSTTDEYSADVAIDDNDNIIVTWVENSGLKENIYIQKLDQGGNLLWSSPVLIASSTDNNASPSLLTDNNNIFLSWTEYNASLKDVYIAKLDTDGNMLWSKKANIESLTDNQYNPSITISAGILLVSWTDDRYGNEDIYAQRYDLDGNVQWATDLKLNTTMSNSNQDNAEIIINSSNKYYATWQDDESTLLNIYATNFINPSVNSPLANVPIVVSGTKQIGDSPVILEYSQEHSSDAGGNIIIPLEWDSPGYSFQIGTTSALNVISVSEITPFEVGPADNKNIILYVQ
jgi:hypothetical protein